jgi:hypothetical protein
MYLTRVISEVRASINGLRNCLSQVLRSIFFKISRYTVTPAAAKWFEIKLLPRWWPNSGNELITLRK